MAADAGGFSSSAWEEPPERVRLLNIIWIINWHFAYTTLYLQSIGEPEHLAVWLGCERYLSKQTTIRVPAWWTPTAELWELILIFPKLVKLSFSVQYFYETRTSRGLTWLWKVSIKANYSPSTRMVDTDGRTPRAHLIFPKLVKLSFSVQYFYETRTSCRVDLVVKCIGKLIKLQSE